MGGGLTVYHFNLARKIPGVKEDSDYSSTSFNNGKLKRSSQWNICDEA